MGELLNCPFCGGDDIFVEPDETGSGGQWVAPIHVGCKVCQCSQSDDDMDEAIAAWNRRTPQPVTPAGGEVRDFEFLRIVHAYLQKSYIAGVQEITLDELAAVSAAIRSLEHPPVADAALARHWIERYASGVDEELQMDRVLDALGAPSHD